MCLQFTDKVASMLPKKYSQLRLASKPYCSFFFSACINFQVSMQWYFQIYSSFPYQILLFSMRSYIVKQIKTIQDNHHLSSVIFWMEVCFGPKKSENFICWFPTFLYWTLKHRSKSMYDQNLSFLVRTQNW